MKVHQNVHSSCLWVMMGTVMVWGFFPPFVCVLLVFYNEHGTLIKKIKFIRVSKLLREEGKIHNALSCIIIFSWLHTKFPNISCYNEQILAESFQKY